MYYNDALVVFARAWLIKPLVQVIKGWGGFVGCFRFKSQWGQKEEKGKKITH